MTEWDPRPSESERNTDLIADTPSQLPPEPLALTAVRAETSRAAVASEYTTSSQPPGPSRLMVSVNIRSATSGETLLKVHRMPRYNMLANLKRTLALARDAGEHGHGPSGGLQVASLHQNKVMTKDSFPAGTHLELAALFHTKYQVGDTRFIHHSEFSEGA